MTLLKHPFAPIRSLPNKLLLAAYFIIDIVIVGIVFVWLDETMWNQFGDLFMWSRGWIVGPFGLVGLLLIMLSGYLLLGSFPTTRKAVARMFAEKVTAVILLFAASGSWQVSLFLYALAELLSLAAGFGGVLLLHRITNFQALWFLDQQPKSPTWWQVLKRYIWSMEMVLTIVFAGPLLIWSYMLLHYGYSIYRADSDYHALVVLGLWLFATIPLIIERYRYMNGYFIDWYADFNRRQGSTK